MFHPLITKENTKSFFLKTLFLLLGSFGAAIILGMLAAIFLQLTGRGMGQLATVSLELNFWLTLAVSGLILYWLKGEKVLSQALPWDKTCQRLIHLNLIACLSLLLYTDFFSGLAEMIAGGWQLILTSFWAAASAGIGEEAWMRGLVFAAFLCLFSKKPKSLTKTAIVSSLLFGLTHLTNLIAAEPLAVLQQVFYASCFGLTFAVLRVGYNNLWLPVLVHFLIDFQPAILNPVTSNSWLELLIIFIPSSILALVTLNRMDKTLDKSQLVHLP